MTTFYADATGTPHVHDGEGHTACGAVIQHDWEPALPTELSVCKKCSGSLYVLRSFYDEVGIKKRVRKKTSNKIDGFDKEARMIRNLYLWRDNSAIVPPDTGWFLAGLGSAHALLDLPIVYSDGRRVVREETRTARGRRPKAWVQDTSTPEDGVVTGLMEVEVPSAPMTGYYFMDEEGGLTSILAHSVFPEDRSFDTLRLYMAREGLHGIVFYLNDTEIRVVTAKECDVENALV